MSCEAPHAKASELHFFEVWSFRVSVQHNSLYFATSRSLPSKESAAAGFAATKVVPAAQDPFTKAQSLHLASLKGVQHAALIAAVSAGAAISAPAFFPSKNAVSVAQPAPMSCEAPHAKAS